MNGQLRQRQHRLSGGPGLSDELDRQRTNPKKVIFTVERTNLSEQTVQDTTVLYFADPNS